MDSSDATGEDQSLNSMEAAGSGAPLDLSTNSPYPIADASRPIRTYHRTSETLTTHGKSPTRVGHHYSQVRPSYKNRSLQTGGAFLPEVTAHRHLPVQNFGANLSSRTPHENRAVHESDANCSTQKFDCNETLPTLDYNLPIQPQPLDLSLPAQIIGANSCVQNLEGNWPVRPPASNLSNQPSDVDLLAQPLVVDLSIKPPNVSQPDQTKDDNSPLPILSAQPIQRLVDDNMTVKTLGAYVGRDLTANNVSIFNVNPSSSTKKQRSKKPPFRFNIPTPTPHFKGRQETFKAVLDYFDNLPVNMSSCWPRIVAIIGMGGMGKTETAHKFVSESKDKFLNAAWINAETQQATLNSFEGLAEDLGIIKQDHKGADVNLVKKVYRQIAQEDYGNVLLIFDNAIRLGSDGAEFGILEYLPTDELPNDRYPNILITTQTADWGKRIKTFQVHGLSEKDSLEFFSSCFKVQSSECAEEFKTLHELLEGYPLCMNLAASSIDFVCKKDSVHYLKQQIKLYVGKVRVEQNKLTNEKIKSAWGNKYNKTLSTVWQLTQERLEQEENGPEALEMLQIMSFLHLPVDSNELVRILYYSIISPHPEWKNIQFRLKKLSRVLEKLYVVRILEVHKDDEKRFMCTLGLHRLVQLVVRQETNCEKALESLLRYKVCEKYWSCSVNLSALDEILKNPRTQLNSRLLTILAVHACEGSAIARNFFETRKPETETAASIWHLYGLMTGATTSNENSIQAIREIVGLTKPSELLVDRKFFAEIALALVYPDLRKYLVRENLNSLYLNLDIVDNIDNLTLMLILNICLFDDSKNDELGCQKFDIVVVYLIEKLVKRYLGADKLKPKSVVVERLAATWLALLANQRDYVIRWESQWEHFWKTMYRTFNLPDASPLKIAELRTCLWDRGLAQELIQAFERFRQFDSCYFLRFPECADVCLHGMDLLDMRVQQVIPAFTNMTIRLYSQFETSNYIFEIVLAVCLVWIKLLLMDEEPTSGSLLQCLSCCEALNWFQVTSEDSIRKEIKGNSWWMRGSHIFQKSKGQYFPIFIQRYSSSVVERIKALVTFCNLLMEPPI